jgi:ABC-type lipoprotein export system ATPase subunit
LFGGFLSFVGECQPSRSSGDISKKEIMQRLNEQTGTAFIFATHDPRVVTLRNGRIDGNGTNN